MPARREARRHPDCAGTPARPTDYRLKSLKDRDFVRPLGKTMPREAAADVSMRAIRDEGPVMLMFKIGSRTLPGDETPALKDAPLLQT